MIGYDLAGLPTPARLVFDWRIDLIFGALEILLASAYLAGVRRLRRRGHPWPLGRTVLWLAGCLVLLLATSSDVGRYGPAMFSVHLAQQVLLAVVAPVLLVPWTARRDGAPREWLTAAAFPHLTCRLLTHPAVGFALLVVPMVLLYAAGGFSSLVGNRWAHSAMNAYFLTAGYLLFWPAVGPDPVPRRLSAAGRAGVLAALLATFAALALVVMGMHTILGEGFYWSLALPWTGDQLADQRLGAIILWIGADLPVLTVLAVLLTRWATRETPRPVNNNPTTSV